MFKQTLPRYRPWPGNESYLELHRNATERDLDNTRLDDEQATELYTNLVWWAIREFEHRAKTEVFLLGRSGRHVCVEDTPENSRRYQHLKQLALQIERTVIADYNGYDPEGANK